MMLTSAQEAKAEYVKAMGREIGPVFHALVCEVHHLHVKWGDYTALFDKEKRVALLNQVAPAYFARLQDMYVHDTFLHISRLTDEPKNGKYRHLTINGLVAMIDVRELRRKLSPMVKDMNRMAKVLRKWRDRKIAHTEYELALGHATEPLPPTTRAKTRETIEAIAAVLNAICAHYCDSNHRFRYESRAGTGALALLHCMDDGLKAAAQRDARIAAREYLPEDLETADL
jgi:AbiU2